MSKKSLCLADIRRFYKEFNIIPTWALFEETPGYISGRTVAKHFSTFKNAIVESGIPLPINPLCSYECGQPAQYWLDSGSWCCSDHRNKCPGMIKKNSDGNQKTTEERAEILEKYRETCLENFGVDSFPKTEQWSTKTIETNLERYGFANQFSNPDVQAKQQQTMIERHGAPFALQVPELNEKRLDTLEEKYGVRNPGLLGDVQSKECCEWLDYLGIPEEWREESIPGTPYSADAFDVEKNILYEYYGDFFHGGPIYKDRRHEINVVAGKTFAQLYAYTMARQEYLEKKGYTFIVIWSSEWHKLKKMIGQQP